MDAIQDQLRDLFEGQIDFKGQQLADTLTTILLYLTGISSLLTGYTHNDIFLSLWTCLAGGLLTAVVVVPPWPVYNRNPVGWWEEESVGEEEEEEKKKKKKKKEGRIVYENGGVKMI